MKIWARVVGAIDSRHDQVSAVRQRRFAGMLLSINAAIAIVTLGCIGFYHWHPSIRPLVIFFAPLWIVSLAMLSIAVGMGTWLRDLADAITESPAAPDPVREQRRIARVKYMYYPGAWLNVLSIAVLVEVTDGLLRSPFTALLMTVLLMGQQLSRHVLQSGCIIVYGVGLTVCLLLFESLQRVRVGSEAPHSLVFAVLALSFLITAVVTHVGKSPNDFGSDRRHPPNSVRLYQDRPGVWRYQLYRGRHAFDSVLVDREPSETGDSPPTVVLELLLESMGSIAGWPPLHVVWKESSSAEWTAALSEKVKPSHVETPQAAKP